MQVPGWPTAGIGLGVKVWMAENGYARAGHTRMLFSDPPTDRIRIVFPLRKRRHAPEPALIHVNTR